MQFIHDFGISPVQYYLKGQDNDFPDIEKCPYCHDHMIKHGFYKRYVISNNGNAYIIFIRRYKCKHCNRTVSFLPSFLLPYFLRSLKLIMNCLEQYFLKGNYFFSHRQTHFYCSRFRDNLPGLLSFFREKLKSTLKFEITAKKKAIKLIEMIKSSPAQTFSRRYHNHFNQSFMAL